MRINVLAIKRLLSGAGMTQRALSAASGVHMSVISATLARGSCSIKTAGRLAAALGVDIYDIALEE